MKNEYFYSIIIMIEITVKYKRDEHITLSYYVSPILRIKIGYLYYICYISRIDLSLSTRDIILYCDDGHISGEYTLCDKTRYYIGLEWRFNLNGDIRECINHNTNEHYIYHNGCYRKNVYTLSLPITPIIKDKDEFIRYIQRYKL
jgi:hypothetical protein